MAMAFAAELELACGRPATQPHGHAELLIGRAATRRRNVRPRGPMTALASHARNHGSRVDHRVIVRRELGGMAAKTLARRPPSELASPRGRFRVFVLNRLAGRWLEVVLPRVVSEPV